MMAPAVKLLLGAGVVICVTGYMAYLGASSSWKYYVTADECLADPERFSGSRVRVSGRVAAGSLRISENREQADFLLQGQTGELHVVCKALLPDNLNESMDVVVEGRFEPGGTIRGDKVLTRCASKYDAATTVDPRSQRASAVKGE